MRKIAFPFWGTALLYLVLFGNQAHAICDAPVAYEPDTNGIILAPNSQGEYVLKIAYPAGGSEPCGWEDSHWQIASHPSKFVDYDYRKYLEEADYAVIIDRQLRANRVFNKVIQHPDKRRFKLPVTAKDLPPVVYWRARIITRIAVSGHGFGRPKPNFVITSPFSHIASFKQPQTACPAMPTPTLLTPSDRHKIAVTAWPSFKIGSNFWLDAPCKWTHSEFHFTPLNRDETPIPGADFSLTWAKPAEMSETEHSVHHSWRMKPGYYAWRARTISPKKINSAQTVKSPYSATRLLVVGEPSTFPQQPKPQPLEPGDPSCVSLTLPTQAKPENGATVAQNSVHLSLTSPGLSPGCTWDATAWQVIDDSTGEYAYQTGFSSRNRYDLVVPSDRLQAGGQYFWRVKILSRGSAENGDNITSPWTDGIRFRVE